MAVRLLVMFSVMIFELGLGITAILALMSNYRYTNLDEMGSAGCVMISLGILIAWLVTIAGFVRHSARSKANRIIDEAKAKSAKILSEATEKALALCSLEGARCRSCGNPRTGKFCPKCGTASEVGARV